VSGFQSLKPLAPQAIDEHRLTHRRSSPTARMNHRKTAGQLNGPAVGL